MKIIEKNKKHLRRKKGLRKTIFGTSERPRVCISRSNKHIFAQIVDDSLGKTLASVSDLKLKSEKKVEIAKKLGLNLGAIAKKNKIDKIVFDRSGYNYHGRVKAFAEGMRESGINF